MVATWLQFSKWPVLHPDVNTPGPMVLKHASIHQNNPKQSRLTTYQKRLKKSNGFLTDGDMFIVLFEGFWKRKIGKGKKK